MFTMISMADLCLSFRTEPCGYRGKVELGTDAGKFKTGKFVRLRSYQTCRIQETAIPQSLCKT